MGVVNDVDVVLVEANHFSHIDVSSNKDDRNGSRTYTTRKIYFLKTY